MIFKDIKILDKDFKARVHQNVVIEGEYITYVGADPVNEDGHEVIDGTDKFLMPAFYNTHCHVPMTLLRGYGEGLPLQKWLNTRIFPFEAKFYPDEKYRGAALGACELIKSGCVSISDMYFDLVRYGSALYEAGMKANLSNCLVTFDENSSYAGCKEYKDTMELIAWMKDHTDGRIRADVAVHSEYCSKMKPAAEAAAFAAENGLNMQIHISETKREHEECIKRNGMTPVQYFKKCGAFEVPVTAAHCVWLTDEDMAVMKSAGAFVAHNASSNMKLGSGIAPIKKYYDAGMNITIGTDGASSNNNLNMLEEVHLAAMLCRGQSMDANAIPAGEMLKMATYGGAMAQGRTDCGVLDKGKRADLIMFDLDTAHLQPDFDTISNIVFSAQSSDIVMTMCDGRVLYRDGKLMYIDEEKAIAEARKSFEKVCSRLD